MLSKRSLCSIEDILAETDSDSDEDEKPKKGQKKPMKKGQAWLKEGVSDEPLNFLDPKAAQRVLGKGSLDMSSLIRSSQIDEVHSYISVRVLLIFIPQYI